MLISELIKKLEEVKKQYGGRIPVKIEIEMDNGFFMRTDISDITVGPLFIGGQKDELALLHGYEV